MKRILFTALALLAALTAARADGRSEKTLGAMSAAIKALGSYRMTFSVSAGGEIDPMDGQCTVSGERYNITLPTGTVFGDEKTAAKVDPQMKTVTLTRVDPTDKSLLSNPARAFELLDGTFTHRYVGQAQMSGKDCAQIELTPVDNTLPIKKMTLYIATQGSLPVAVRYNIDGLDSPVTVEIKSVKGLPQVDGSLFAFDKKRWKGYEIIDLR